MRFIWVVFSVVFVFSVPAYSAVPEIKKDCGLCHVSHSMGGGYLLNAPLKELCMGCHPDRKDGNDHAVDIVPKMEVSGLPLDAEGKITCITCHEPHGRTGFAYMLRAVSPELCTKCHGMK